MFVPQRSHAYACSASDRCRSADVRRLDTCLHLVHLPPRVIHRLLPLFNVWGGGHSITAVCGADNP